MQHPRSAQPGHPFVDNSATHDKAPYKPTFTLSTSENNTFNKQ